MYKRQTLDGGFYTAAGVLPPCKYFCVTNMPLDDQWTDQQAVLKAGAVDYVEMCIRDSLSAAAVGERAAGRHARCGQRHPPRRKAAARQQLRRAAHFCMAF